MRRPLGWLGMLPLLVCTAEAADAPSGLRCEWRVSPADVRDPCPEFFWEVPWARPCAR